MLQNKSGIFISSSGLNEGESMIDRYGEMIKVDHAFYSPISSEKSILDYIKDKVDQSNKNYLFKIESKAFDSLFNNSMIEEELLKGLKSISILNGKESDFEDAYEILDEVVIPNIYNINKFLAPSSVDFVTYILKPSFIETSDTDQKQITALFKVINLYENNLIESFDFYNSKSMRINEDYELSHFNIGYYSFDYNKSRYLYNKFHVLEEDKLRELSTRQIYSLIPYTTKLDITEHKFLIDRQLVANNKDKYKQNIFNIIFRPMKITKKIKHEESENYRKFNGIHFYGNKNHSYIYADKSIKNIHADPLPDRTYTNAIFYNIFPSLYDTLIDLHIYQKLRNVYDLFEKLDKDVLMQKKHQIYSFKMLKERAYNPTLLSFTDLAVDLRKSLLPIDSEDKLERHYNEMDVAMSEIQQNEIVKGQNKIQLILLIISILALIVSVLNLDLAIQLKLALSFSMILIALVIYNDVRLFKKD